MFGHHGRKEEEERRRREEEERLRWEREKHHHSSPPPPPMTSHHGGYGGPTPPPYGSNVQHVSHETPHHTAAPGVPSFAAAPGHFPSAGHQQPYPPPPSTTTHHAAAPPAAYGSNVQHVSHESPHQPAAPGGPSFAGSGIFPSTGHNQHLSSQKTYRIYPKAGEGFSLTIRNGQVVLAKANHKDEHQHWYKDEKYSTKVKDQEGCPAFSLVNKATGEAIKHAIGQEHPVRLVQYNSNYLDESVLWTESKDIKNGFRCIRMVNNIKLAFDAFHGDKEHGGVHDGTTVVLWEPWNGDNEIWKIVPY